MNEEYILLSGGINTTPYLPVKIMEHVYKFNGTWHPFGQLRRPRVDHRSIYWNGAVYFIGGRYRFNGYLSQMYADVIELPARITKREYLNDSEVDEDLRVRMEVWKIQDLPDRFETTENWPELFNWQKPHLFIVQDSFFPDH